MIEAEGPRAFVEGTFESAGLALEGVSAEEGEKWEEHSTERDVLRGLKARADLIVDADESRDFVANTALEWLNHT